MEQQDNVKRMIQWKKSEDYAKQYVLFQAKVDQIISVYEINKDNICRMANMLDEIATHTEIGSASDLHRGYYCPSLTYDIVVGNVKRGKLLKRLSPKSKRYYIYGFDDSNRMLWCKEFSNKVLVSVEYLVYVEDYRYGFKFSTHHPLFAVTQEKIQNGRIQNYLYGHGFRDGTELVWVEWQEENYAYDEIGLKTCDVYRVRPAVLDLTHDVLKFTRDNGYLRSYYRETLIGFEETEVLRTSPVYEVIPKRKA